MALEEQVRWAEREQKNADPVEFYREYYGGLTRGELAEKDNSLYQKLRRNGLLDSIPLKKKAGKKL